MAITKFDQFDFLIDIVPRDDLKPPKRQVGKRPHYSIYYLHCDRETAGISLKLPRDKELMIWVFISGTFHCWQPGGAVNILDWKLRF